jgi:hypothetical protein
MHARNRLGRHFHATSGLVLLLATLVPHDARAQDNRGSASSTPSATSTAGSDGTWAKAADEWTTFTVSGTQRVRYGAGTHWIEASAAGSTPCRNDYFGHDPLVGVGLSTRWAALCATSERWTRATSLRSSTRSCSGSCLRRPCERGGRGNRVPERTAPESADPPHRCPISLCAGHVLDARGDSLVKNTFLAIGARNARVTTRTT